MNDFYPFEVGDQVTVVLKITSRYKVTHPDEVYTITDLIVNAPTDLQAKLDKNFVYSTDGIENTVEFKEPWNTINCRHLKHFHPLVEDTEILL